MERLRELAEVELADIVLQAFVPDINELRIILSDDSFVDVWFSLKLPSGTATTGSDGRLMGRSTTMTTRRTSVGNRWRPFPGIFTMVVSSKYRRAVSAKSQKKHCGSSSLLCEAG